MAIATSTMAGAVAAAAAIGEQARAGHAPTYGYRVVRSYSHDPQAFTQGLVYFEGALYESTGLNGQSSIRKVKLENGEVLQIRKLDDKYFGEGIAIWQRSLIQLTWQSEVGFVYDRDTFEPTRTFTYTGEGWGLTQDGTRLIMSDGSPYLRFFDPATMKQTGRLAVRDAGVLVEDLNELEVVKGEIFANVWQSERIARISPNTGRVTGWIDLRGLLAPAEAAQVDVMNGIAYDPAGDRLCVTGKLWPRLFEIQLVPPRS